jgi:hypothetical protein
MKPSGLVTHGRALHKFFVRKYRARDVASDGLTVLPGRQPYFDGQVGQNLIVYEGNLGLLRILLGINNTLTGSNTFIGVSNNETAPLRTDTGLGGDAPVYKVSNPSLIYEDVPEAYILNEATFGADDANFLWARGSVCCEAGLTPGEVPDDDTDEECWNWGMVALEDPQTKGTGEVWILSSRFNLW